MKLTHHQLTRRAMNFLKNNRIFKCSVVTCERGSSYNTETPDALGFKGGSSILIECKTSRADFLVDKKKFFRKHPWDGMGDRRFFLIPAGLVSPDELPENWGLLEVHEKQIRVKKESKVFEETNKKAEVVHLTSFIRRLEISSAVFVRHEEEE